MWSPESFGIIVVSSFLYNCNPVCIFASDSKFHQCQLLPNFQSLSVLHEKKGKALRIVTTGSYKMFQVYTVPNESISNFFDANFHSANTCLMPSTSLLANIMAKMISAEEFLPTGLDEWNSLWWKLGVNLWVFTWWTKKKLDHTNQWRSGTPKRNANRKRK